MRKVLSILLIVMILFSGVTIHLASHYCRASLIDTRVSLSGKLAGCGMEHPQKHNSDFTYSNKCCEDVLSNVILNNNYLASSLASVDLSLQCSYVTALKAELVQIIEASFPLSEIFSRPPGTYIPNEVEQQIICIFRI